MRREEKEGRREEEEEKREKEGRNKRVIGIGGEGRKKGWFFVCL